MKIITNSVRWQHLTPQKKTDHWIKDGSHLMIYNRAAEINKLLAGILSGL